jgi:hypothetical protein
MCPSTGTADSIAADKAACVDRDAQSDIAIDLAAPFDAAD